MPIAGYIHGYGNRRSGMARIEGGGAVNYRKTICEGLAIYQRLASNDLYEVEESEEEREEMS